MIDDKIKISWDDIRAPKVDEALQRQQQERATALPPPVDFGRAKAYPPLRNYGTVATPRASARSGRAILSTPLYTCVAGLIGAVLGWGVTEAVWGEATHSGSNVLVHIAMWFGLIGACIGASVGAVEGVMSRALAKALKGGAIGLAVGLTGCAIGGMIAQFIYSAILAASSTSSLGPVMVARTIGWGAAGCFVGLGQGLAMLSGRKTLNGFLGGLEAALLAGSCLTPYR